MKYELTLTLRPILYRFTPQEQLERTLEIVQTCIECAVRDRYSLVAELTGENNIHYHALLELRNNKHRDLLLNKFRLFHNKFGRKTCNQVQFEQSYLEYMGKDIDKTWEILGQCPIFNDYYNVMSARPIAAEKLEKMLTEEILDMDQDEINSEHAT